MAFVKRVTVEMNARPIVKETKKVEIELPLFRLNQAGDEHTYDVYTMITEDLTAYVIVETDRSIEVEFLSRTTFLDDSPEDYHLGRGCYACTREEFEAVLARAEAMQANIRKELAKT